MVKESWSRDDGWEVQLEVDSNGVITKISHLPLSVRPRPVPLTYKYVTEVLFAYGYVLDRKTNGCT